MTFYPVPTYPISIRYMHRFIKTTKQTAYIYIYWWNMRSIPHPHSKPFSFVIIQVCRHNYNPVGTSDNYNPVGTSDIGIGRNIFSFRRTSFNIITKMKILFLCLLCDTLFMHRLKIDAQIYNYTKFKIFKIKLFDISRT